MIKVLLKNESKMRMVGVVACCDELMSQPKRFFGDASSDFPEILLTFETPLPKAPVAMGFFRGQGKFRVTLQNSEILMMIATQLRCCSEGLPATTVFLH